MGTDIHIFVRGKEREDKYEDGYIWWQTFLNNVDPGRIYSIFAKLAGVRNYNEVTPLPSRPWSEEDIKQYDPADFLHSCVIITAEDFLTVISPEDLGPWGSLAAYVKHLSQSHIVELLLGFDS